MNKDVNDCVTVSKKIAKRIRKQCMGNSLPASMIKDLETDTIDQHETGIWKGWVHHAEIMGSTGIPSKGIKWLIIDKSSEEIKIKAGKNTNSKELTKANFWELVFNCPTKYPCTPVDYGIAKSLGQFDSSI